MLTRSSEPLDSTSCKQMESMDGIQVVEDEMSKVLTKLKGEKVYMCTGRNGFKMPVMGVDCIEKGEY